LNYAASADHNGDVIERLILTAGLILAGILIYRFHRPIFGALRRFDADNRARKFEELRDRSDQLAHFRHTLKRAEEQVETVGEIATNDERTGTPVTRYVFEGEQFATRSEAENVRADKVRSLARTFYIDLPAALAARKGDGRIR
jgi:hypothetical protein